MPLYFERNLGQSDPSVRYLSHYQSIIVISHRRFRGDYDGRRGPFRKALRSRVEPRPRTSWLSLRFESALSAPISIRSSRPWSRCRAASTT